jgi:CRP-like cAMP-binding protein
LVVDAPTVVYRRIRPKVSVTERVEAPACICAGADVAAENHLLSLLDASTRALLEPHMRTVALEHGEVLHGSASKLEFAYFPQSSIISVLARTEQGQTAETSIVGREGMIGSSAIHGIVTTFAEAVVQVRGEAVRIPAPEVHRVGQVSESFRKVVALFDLSLLAQSQQSTACQALHQVENRAARWLLQCRKRLGSNDIRLTQEFFGQMLGVQRTTINLVERTLQKAGLIQIGRGRLSILDVEGLHAVACDCYERIERRYDELLGPLPQDSA